MINNWICVSEKLPPYENIKWKYLVKTGDGIEIASFYNGEFIGCVEKPKFWTLDVDPRLWEKGLKKRLNAMTKFKKLAERKLKEDKSPLSYLAMKTAKHHEKNAFIELSKYRSEKK